MRQISKQNHDNSTTNLNSYIDLHTHAGSTFENRMTLTYDLFTLGLMYAKRLPCTVYLSNLVVIARVVFLLERGYTHEDSCWHVRHARFPEVILVASWTTRRHSRDDPREDVGVGVVECELNSHSRQFADNVYIRTRARELAIERTAPARHTEISTVSLPTISRCVPRWIKYGLILTIVPVEPQTRTLRVLPSTWSPAEVAMWWIGGTNDTLVSRICSGSLAHSYIVSSNSPNFIIIYQ